MKLPKLFVNFKSYKRGLGKNAIKLANELNIEGIAVSPHWVDLKDVSKIVPSYSQGIEPLIEGPFTSKNTFEALLTTNAVGILLNHSENKMEYKKIKKTVDIAKSFDLKVIVCGESVEEVIKLNNLDIDAIAFEVKSLIGTGIPITEKNRKELIKIINEVNLPIYAGAGISKGKDARKAIELGCYGVFVSSAIVKSNEPRKKAIELLESMKQI